MGRTVPGDAAVRLRAAAELLAGRRDAEAAQACRDVLADDPESTGALQMLGVVDVARFQVMELPGLLHGWSKFSTRPRHTGNTASCLRAVFPYGMQPLPAGLEKLRQHERFLRGPYYGLVGYIQPDGEFSFTQVLRAAFADRSSNYLIAGAAITRQSTAELEVAETCSKLATIGVFEKNQSAP